jgi:acyl-CoA thioester hydrolase
VKKYTYTFTVPKDAIDFNGHVNNITYLAWMIDAAERHSESVGYGHEACLALGGTWVAKSHHIEYKRPAFEGDELRMETWVEEIGKIMSIRRYRLSNLKKDMVICEGSTEWVFVDSKKMRPIKIPEVVVEAFKKDLKLL